jgi:23S rRNA pseudouridine1911/1915/1917 synthase
MKVTLSHPMTLLDALGQLCPDSSKNALRQFARSGRVFVDDKPALRVDVELTKGQVVRFEERKVKWQDELKIVYEDPHFVVVDKPHGLLSVATNFEKKETVHSQLKKRYHPKKVFVIHRLDQDTSGLIMFTTSHESYLILKQALKERHVSRTYEGIVEGKLQGSGTWSSYLREDATYYMHSSDNADEGGELAVTHYQAGRYKNGYTHVTFRLDTGKKNQIRVHCAKAGHPIAGDKKYGAKTNAFGRLALHAVKLEFVHPITKKQLTFCSTFPISL